MNGDKKWTFDYVVKDGKPELIAVDQATGEMVSSLNIRKGRIKEIKLKGYSLNREKLKRGQI